MMTPPLYVFKIKYFGENTWRFVNEGIIASPKEIVAHNLDFFMSKDLRRTQKLMLNLIMQSRPEVEAMKIVELSHYPPYSEFKVIQYQEMKKCK